MLTFADTGGEKPETMAHIDKINRVFPHETERSRLRPVRDAVGRIERSWWHPGLAQPGRARCVGPKAQAERARMRRRAINPQGRHSEQLASLAAGHGTALRHRQPRMSPEQAVPAWLRALRSGNRRARRKRWTRGVWTEQSRVRMCQFICKLSEKLRR